MGRRSKRQRRRGAKKSPPGSAAAGEEEEMRKNQEKSPENNDIEPDDGMLSDGAPASTTESPIQSGSPAITAEERDSSCGGGDGEENELNDTQQQSFDVSLNQPEDSTTVPLGSRVTGIGIIDSTTTVGEKTAAYSLSPIAVSKEVRVNREFGSSLGLNNESEGASTDSARGSFDSVDSLRLKEVASDEGNNTSNSPYALTEQLTLDQETTREGKDTRDEEQLTEPALNDYELTSPTSRRLTILSPIEEREFETPGTYSNDCLSSQSESQALGYLLNETNDSVMTSGSARDDEIARTQEELGATSLAFLHRLRGAAFRRKKALVHSRDDMAAKERSHREDIEAARLLRRNSAPDQSTLAPPSKEQNYTSASSDYTFKARPAPALLFSGSVGVPKVEKRPVTVALSPLLGSRRHQTPSNKVPASVVVEPGAKTSFTALALPKTTGDSGRGGQSGLPKVPKRPVTEAISPTLGPRRQKDAAGTDSSANAKKSNKSGFKALPIPKSLKTNGVSGVPRIPSRPTTVAWSPLLGFRRRSTQEPKPIQTNDESHDSVLTQNGSMSTPLGVKLLSTPIVNENEPPVLPSNVSLASSASLPGYQPHSTVRAQKRAEFDAYLAAREKERLAEESRRRTEQAKALKRELGELRKGLS